MKCYYCDDELDTVCHLDEMMNYMCDKCNDITTEDTIYHNYD